MGSYRDKRYSDYYAELFDKLKIKIATEMDDFIISQPTEDLVKYYFDNALQPIVYDSDLEENIRHKKFIKTIRSQDREWGYHQDGDLKIECESLELSIPIIPNKNIDEFVRMRTDTISLSGAPAFDIRNNRVYIELEIKGYGINLSDETISSRILQMKNDTLDYINSKSNFINNQNRLLKINLEEFINERKQKLDSDNVRFNNLVKKIKIPLARKAGDTVNKIQLDIKPFVKKLRPKTNSEDYTLDASKVLDVIRIIDNQCLQFEKTPATYQKMDEPNLRDLILANLNSIFEGKATGETFSNHGKSDIYLNIEKGNILICECKIYSGKVLYHSTIDQILSYLSWRHNFGIMINFCRQKEFSKILKDAESIIKSHASYQDGFEIVNESHFISKNTLPIDEYKYVKIHHLYYNLYYK